MEWDVGPQGLALMAAISLGFGVLAGLVVGHDLSRRLLATAVTTVSCFAVGLFTSEVLFGWATEEELQPNVDGLSRDEVLLSSVLTTLLVVLTLRHVASRPANGPGRRGRR